MAATSICGKPTITGAPCQNPSGCAVDHKPYVRSGGTAAQAAAQVEGAAAGEAVSQEAIDSMSEMQAAMVELVASGRYGEYLESRAKFRRYSNANQAMIWMQRPDATLVAPLSTWNQLGRYVNKGEQSIKIWVPRKSRRTVENPTTGEEETVERVYFSTGRVFDVSQTNGDPLPELAPDLQGDAPAEMKTRLHSVAAEAGIPVREKVLPAGVGGYWDPAANEIVLAADASDADKAATLAHELGHAFDPELSKDPGIYKEHRADCEAVAESVSYMVARRYGLDTTEQASGYLTSWTKGNPERIAKVLDRVDAAAKRILPPSHLDELIGQASKDASAAYKAKKKAKGQKKGSRAGKKAA